MKVKNKCALLNIGAGKPYNHVEYLDYTSNVNYFMVNLDKSYFTGISPDVSEKIHSKWLSNKLKDETKIVGVKCDIFEFLERYKYKFDVITMFRFFEHIPREKLLYFIYLISTSIEVGGMVDVIAPDYQLLAQQILNEDPYEKDFDKHDIIISTEMFNEVSDPHQNITTPKRIEKLFEYEGRFKVEELFKPYLFDGRKIYFRSLIRRI